MKIDQRGKNVKDLLYVKYKTKPFSKQNLLDIIILTGLSSKSKNSIRKVINYLVSMKLGLVLEFLKKLIIT